MNTYETLVPKDLTIWALWIAALSATAGTIIDEADKITISIQNNATNQWKGLLKKIGNDIEFLIRNKELEYVQLIVLKVFLKKIFRENFELKLASWTMDVADKTDAILTYEGRIYNLDFTLGAKSTERKKNDPSKNNLSDWIVFQSAPGIRNFLSYTLNGYSWDYSEESIIRFLEENPDVIDNIDCHIIDRKTHWLPKLIQRELEFIECIV